MSSSVVDFQENSPPLSQEAFYSIKSATQSLSKKIFEWMQLDDPNNTEVEFPFPVCFTDQNTGQENCLSGLSKRAVSCALSRAIASGEIVFAVAEEDDINEFEVKYFHPHYAKTKGVLLLLLLPKNFASLNEDKKNEIIEKAMVAAIAHDAKMKAENQVRSRIERTANSSFIYRFINEEIWGRFY